MVLAAIAVAAQAVFVMWAAVAVRRHALNPNTVKLRYAILAFTTALRFGIIGHRSNGMNRCVAIAPDVKEVLT